MNKCASIILAVILTASLAAGCGSGGGSTSGSPAEPGSVSEAVSSEAAASADSSTEQGAGAADLSGEVIIWEWNVTPYDEHMTADFNKVYPNLKLNILSAGNSDEVVAKFITALTADSDVPDMIPLEIGSRGRLTKIDVLENLEAAPYNVDRSKVLDVVLPMVTNGNDEIVGVEATPCPAGYLYVRDNTIEYLGTDDPEELIKLFPDWDAFYDKCLEIKDKSGGAVLPYSSLGDLATLYAGMYSAPYVTADGTLNLQESLLPTLKMLEKFNNAGLIGKIDQWSPAWYSSMATKDYVFYPCAPWVPNYALKPNDPDGTGKWGFMPLPGGKYASWGGTMFSVPKAAKNKEGGWAFIDWRYNGLEGAKYNYELFKDLSWLKEPYTIDGFFSQKDEYFADLPDPTQMYVKYIDTIVARELTKYDPMVSQAIDAAYPMILSGKTAEEIYDTTCGDLIVKDPELKRVER